MEWVEIREPSTGKPLFVNTVTGDCRWELPEDVRYKPCHDDQWWQLFDSKTNRAYYFNYAMQTTLWEYPATGDVVALDKLQAMQESALSNGAPGADGTSPTAEPTYTSPAPPQQTEPEPEESEAIPATPPAPPAPPSGPTLIASPPRPNAGVTSREPRRSTMPAGSDNLVNYKSNFAVHKKGIFRKKVSIATMLSWSKEAISAPMLTTTDKKIRKDAMDLFKQVQMFMGDRKLHGRAQMELCCEIVAKCWAGPQLRDELFLQLCKQTTLNRNAESCLQGWVLLCICLNFFPPSNKFYYYLQGYISRHTEGDTDLNHHAQHALKKLERARITGAKKGSQPPSQEEIDHAKISITRTPVFGSSLEDLMDLQASTFPDLRIPRVLQVLANAILDQKGHQTEGIFRVPGDIDAVNTLKVALNSGELLTFADPHIPGSALKLWFRELPDPIITNNLYDACVSACEDPQAAIALVSQLPHINYEVLLFIIHFLQIIGEASNHKHTKMTYDNLAMVWAPNLLRCVSDDPMVIFNNTRREMLFVRQLVTLWDTSSAAPLK